MKKFIFLISLATSLAASAQSFHKGALTVDLTTGIDAYVVKYHYALKQNQNFDTTITDGAGSKSQTLGIEYGVLDWLALGLRGKYDNYYTSKDKYTGIQPTVTGFEVGGLVDFHLVRKEHFNLALGMEIGYSNLLYKSNDPWGTEIYGSGSWTNFHLMMRYYYKRFGIGISLHKAGINYPNMTTSSTTINNYIVSSWKGSGGGFNIGIAWRFLNPR